MYPPSLALVGDDSAFAAALCPVLLERGVLMRWFASAEELLADPSAMDRDFCVLDLQQPGLGGLALLTRLRQHTQVGVLVVTTESGPGVFAQVMQEGGDMPRRTGCAAESAASSTAWPRCRLFRARVMGSGRL